MKSPLLVSLVLALLAAAAFSAAAGGAGGRTLVGFRSPTGNIKCHYDPHGLGSPNPTRLVRCSLDHADYAAALQRRCLAGDWHGFTLMPARKPFLFCPGGASGDRITYTTLAYGKSWRRGPYTCTSRVTGVTCRNGTGHGLFVSRQAYRTW